MCWRKERGLTPLCDGEDVVKLLDTPELLQGDDADGCGQVARDIVFVLMGRKRGGPMATATDGTHPSTLEAAFRLAGLAVQSGTMTLADLQHHTKLGRPVVCPIASFGGHWVVVRGVGRGLVYYACPAEGRVHRRVSEWLDLWRDSTRAGHAFDRWGIAVGAADDP